MRATARDKALLAEVAEGKYYLREQLQELFFRGIQGPQKAQERLRKLYHSKELKRRRVGSQGGYVYYTEKWSEKYAHWLMLNWVKVAFVSQAKSWQKVSVFSREYPIEDIRADALTCVDNMVTKKRDTYFVEADNGTNPFVDKYTKLYEKISLSLDPPWWAVDKFPKVLVVTNRPEKVRAVVEGSQVRYCVCTLDEVKGDVYRCLVGSSGAK